MIRNIKFVWLLVKMKLARMMAFRVGFFGAFFADAVYFIVQLLMFSVIYGQVETIGDFTRGHMVIFIGTFSIINGISMAVFFFGLLEIPRKIREGTLDVYITKPGSALLRLTFESVNPGSLPLLILSFFIVAWGVSVEGISVTVPLALAYAGMTLLMALLYYDMELIIRTIPFFVISAESIERMEGDLLELNFRIPGGAYKGFFKILFCYIMPYGIMATVPTRLLAGMLSPAGLLQALAVAAGITAFALWFWRFGLKHYKSAGS